jgi:hypothetical protein
MLNRLGLLAVAMLCLMGAQHARAQNTPFFGLMLQALDARDGKVTKTFPKTTPWVIDMRRQFGTQGAVTVTTRIVKAYEQAGCARFENHFRVHEAQVKAGAFEDAQFSFSFNSCRDGQPPSEALDLSVVQRIVQSQSVAPPALPK